MKITKFLTYSWIINALKTDSPKVNLPQKRDHDYCNGNNILNQNDYPNITDEDGIALENISRNVQNAFIIDSTQTKFIEINFSHIQHYLKDLTIKNKIVS